MPLMLMTTPQRQAEVVDALMAEEASEAGS